MQLNETVIRNVVEEVLSRLGANGSAGLAAGSGPQGRHGLFTDPRQAVAAAREAFERLSTRTLEDRRRIIDHIRRISIEQCVELGTMEMEETKIGRLEHKIDKLRTLGQRAPGVEFLRSEVAEEQLAEILGELEILQLLEQFFDRAMYYAALGYEHSRRTQTHSAAAHA